MPTVVHVHGPAWVKPYRQDRFKDRYKYGKQPPYKSTSWIFMHSPKTLNYTHKVNKEPGDHDSTEINQSQFSLQYHGRWDKDQSRYMLQNQYRSFKVYAKTHLRQQDQLVQQHPCQKTIAVDGSEHFHFLTRTRTAFLPTVVHLYGSAEIFIHRPRPPVKPKPRFYRRLSLPLPPKVSRAVIRLHDSFSPHQVTGAPGSRYQPTTVQTHGPVSVQPTQPGRDSPGGGYQPGYQQNQPGQPGYQQTQPGQYGYQPERVSPVPGYQPGRASPQTGYQPGQPGYQPGQPGYQPGRASPQSGYQPGRASPQSGYQPGYQPGQPGYQQQGAPAGSHEQQPSGIYQATPATTYNVALAPGQQPEANEPGSNLTFKKATHKPGEYQPSTGYTYKPATGIPGPDSKQAEARYR